MIILRIFSIYIALMSVLEKLNKPRHHYFQLLKIHFAFFLLLYIPCRGQKKNPDIVNFNTDSGLPQNSVKDIKFDKAGYCWLATEMGIVRFDGKTFNIQSSSEIPGLRSERIQRMATDPKANLYAEAGEMQTLSVIQKSRNTAPMPVLIKNERKHISTTGYVVLSPRLDSLKKTLQNPAKLPGQIEIHSPANGDIYVYHENELYYVQKDKLLQISIKTRSDHKSQEACLGNSYLIQLWKNNEAKIWENGTAIEGITKIHGDIENNADYLAGKYKLLWCESGTFVYSGKKLYRISFEQKQLIAREVFSDVDIPNLTCIYYYPLYQKYYLGSSTKGLYVLTLPLFNYPNIPNEITTQSFYSQVRTQDGRIFSKDGLFSRNGTSVFLPLKSEDGVANYINQNDQLYYEQNFVLKKYDLKTRRSTTILNLKSRLRSIFRHHNDLIFCTTNSVGQLAADTVKFWHKLPANVKAVSLSVLNENSFLLTTESGLKWYNLSKKIIYKSILDSLQIRAIYQDKGRLWIASYGKGVYLYEKGKLYPIPPGAQKSLKIVHAFIDDGSGYFWLPTNNGLFKVSKADLIAYAHGKTDHVYFYILTKENGLNTNEFNGGCDPAYLWMKDSMLSLPSIDGLVWFYPNKIRPAYPDKKIYIDRLLINNKISEISSGQISVSPDFFGLSLNVSCPFFGNPQNIHLEYQIFGLSDIWNTVPENGEIKLSRIPPGNYKIIVRRLSGKAGNNHETLEMKLEVKPWFYNTWWFYLLLLAGFGIVTHLIVRRRLNVLRKESKELEQLVTARTKELSAAVEELAQSEFALLRSTRVKDKVITMVLHDLRSPISFLGTISNYLVVNHKLIDADTLSQKLGELQSGAQALRIFTEQFFAWATSQHEDFKISIKTIILQELFNEISGLYTDIVNNRGNQLIIPETNLTCQSDYQILTLIIRNLIDNANKNTRNGTVSIHTISDDNSITIAVSDTGSGLSETQINYFTDENRVPGNDGIGSMLILKMLKKIGGRLDIETSGHGSTFSITLYHHLRPDTGVQAD